MTKRSIVCGGLLFVCAITRAAEQGGELVLPPAKAVPVEDFVRNFKPRGQTIGAPDKPLSPQESLKRFKIADGLAMDLIANEPDIRQPLGLNFDDRGRLWVVQYIQYPFPAGLKVVKYDQYLRAVYDKVPEPPPRGTPGADKITILEDTDGDGTFDSCKNFITGLNMVTSALPDRDGVWVMNPPYLLFYPDKNHDDIPDGDPEVHLSGFGMEDTHAVANSLTWGPDGWIYGCTGSTTTATVKGIRFLGQAIWRYHPVTHEFELFAEGGGNTWAVEFDEKGRIFSGTNNSDVRGLHFVQGGYYVKNFGKHGPLTNPYAFGYFQHMPHTQPEKLTHVVQPFVVYEGGTLPERFRGQVITAIALSNRIQASKLEPWGSTYKTVDTEPMVTSTDRWFRPVATRVGPDGGLYMSDWYDIRLTHVDPRDNWDRSNGRVFRLRGADAKPVKPFDLTKLSNDELIKTLSHPNKWFHQQALHVFTGRHDKSAVPALAKVVHEQTGQLALEALWALNLSGGFDDAFALHALDHADPFVRAWTVRLLGDPKHVSPAIASKLAALARREQNVEVRSQLASSAKRLPGKDALPIIHELLQHSEDENDPFVPLLLWWAIENKTIADREPVLAMLDTTESWNSPLTAQHIMPRLAQRYAAEGTERDLNTVAQLMNNAPDAKQANRLLSAVADAYKGRKMTIVPPALRQAMAKCGNSSDAAMVLMKVRLGLSGDAEEAFALQFARNENSPAKQRIEFIDALGQSGQPNAVPALLQVLRVAKQAAIQKASLLALQRFNDPQIGREILAAVPELPVADNVRAQAIDVLAKRKDWALALMQAVTAGTVNRANLVIDTVMRMKSHNDPALDALIQKIWGKIQTSAKEKQDQMAAVAALLRSGPGEAASGKKTFMDICGKCHLLHGEGAKIGPDLTSYERDNLDFLLISIVDPSAAIREEYTMFDLATNDGLVLSGFITDQGPKTVTIDDGEAGKVTVARENIKMLRASPISRMPEALLDTMTDQQIRDLFAYIRSKQPIKTTASKK